MKKTNLLIIGTLAAGLLLAGCDHNPRPGTGPLTGQSNPEGAKALKAALGQPDDVIAFDEASATLTVLQDLTIGAAQPSPLVQSLSQAAFDYQAAALFAAAYVPVQNLEIPYALALS
jgi:predicted small secreted protein